VPLLQDRAPEVRRAAGEALGDLRLFEAGPALLYAMSQETERGPGPRVKEAMVRALGVIGGPEAVPALAELLRGGGMLSRFGDPGPRLAAAEALARIGTPQARQALQEWLRSRAPRVQEAARQALEGLTAGKGVSRD
jgi:HEAT repeat protein